MTEVSIKRSNEVGVSQPKNNRNYVIYLADDDSDDQYLVKSSIEKIGSKAEIRFFVNGWELLEHLDDCVKRKVECEPGIILLDLNMPHLNGKDTLARIKETRELRHFPVIIYTTSQSVYDIDEAYRLGANAYLVKPGRFSEMVEAMKNLHAFWFETAELAK